MTTRWPTVPISEVMDAFYDGPHATPPVSDEGSIYLGIKNMTEDGRLDLSEVRRIAWEDFPRWTKRVEPSPGDLVFTYEASLHRYALIPPGFKGCLGRRVALIRPNPSKVDPRFLLYYLISPSWRSTLTSRINIGSTVDRIPLIDFPNFPLSLPPMEVQRKIASLLGSYDELIENNLRRIGILEDMAQSIYREWFVEFRFPGHENFVLEDSPVGLVPKGWEVRLVRELVLRLKSSKIYTPAEVESSGPIPVIDQSRDAILGYHTGEPAHHATAADPIMVFGDHTCKMQLMSAPFSLGPNVVPFKPRIDLPAPYLFYLIRGLVETREYKRHWVELMSKQVAVTRGSVVAQFSTTVRPMHDLTRNLRVQVDLLTRARDVLLPKLISGAVDVSELDIDTSWLAA